MPIQTADLLSPLSQLHPFRMDMGGGENLEMERQRLELMRQQFEETKKRNQQDEEYRRLAQAAETRRAELAIEKDKQQQQAQAAAENLKQRQLAIGEMNKQYLEGNLEGMSLAANQLNQLGGYARLLNPGDPYPAWQIDLEPPKTPQGLNPMDALGYNTLGTPDTLSETEAGAAPELSTEEAFRQAGSVPTDIEAPAPSVDPTSDEVDALTSEHTLPGGAATDEYGPPAARPAAPLPAAIQGLTPGMTNFPARRAAEAPDMTGGVTNDVPTDVINTAALQYQRQQRLGPVMSAMAQAYPESYRDKIGKAGQAMLEAGLSPEKTMQYAQAARQEVAGAVEKEQAHGFKLDEEAAKAAAEEKDPIKVQRRIKFGSDAAKRAFDSKRIQLRVGVLESAREVEQLLSDEDTNNDEKAINLLMKLDEQVGAQSDKDAMRVTGEQKASFSTRIKQWAHQFVAGGYSPELSASMLSFAQSLSERQRGEVLDYVEEMHKQADSNGDPLAGKGYRDFVNGVMPKSILAEYDQEAGDSEEPEASEEPDEEAGDAIIPESSRIARVHNNPGNLKFAGQQGAEQGEPAAGGGHWAKFKSVDDGIAALRSQIERDAKAGLSLREFATKYAPPTDNNDTETYIEQMASALGAQADDKLSAVDLDAAVRFIAKKESSTELPAKKKTGTGSGDAALLEGI